MKEKQQATGEEVWKKVARTWHENFQESSKEVQWKYGKK